MATANHQDGGRLERLVGEAQGHAMQGRYDAARACLTEARALAPGVPVIRLHLGALDEMQGRPDKAEAAYAALVADMPQFAPAHEALARVQIGRGRPAEAETTCRLGLERFPGFAPLHATYGNLLQSLARLPEAEAAYLQALRLQPGDAGVLNNLGLTRKQAGDLEGALSVLQEAVQRAPGFQPALLNLSDTLARLGRPAEAARVCRDCLAQHPRNGTAVAFLALALRDAGNAAAAERLVDPALVQERRIDCPSGFDSQQAFLAALSQEVTAVPSRHSEPGTDDGRQTRELFPSPSPALQALQEVFNRSVGDYAAACRPDPGHPFLAHIPSRWRLKSWATLMRRVREPEITHLHPDSWLSGVFYANLPDAVQKGPAEDGWLEFGRPPFNLYHAVEPPRTTLRPEPGKLVLFPGYFFHRIRPFEGDRVRISIAFDAIPIQGGTTANAGGTHAT